MEKKLSAIQEADAELERQTPDEPVTLHEVGEDAGSRFRCLYRDHLAVVATYAARRTASGEDAADVVAETFLVAWRRIESIPQDAPHLWLLGVTRNVLWNRDRSERRRRRLGAKLADAAAFAEAPIAVSSGNADLAHAFAGLSDTERDILGLVAWEGLDTASLAAVLGCSVNAAKIRLHRTRKHLRLLMTETDRPKEVL